MEENKQYDFCPKCGALMRQGVCQSCEFTVSGYSTQNQELNPSAQQMGMQYNENIPKPQPEKKKNTGLIIGLVIGGVFLALVIVILLVALIAFFGIYTAVSLSDKDESYKVEEAYPDVEEDYPFDYDSDNDYRSDEDDIYNPLDENPVIGDQTFDDIWDEIQKANERIDLDGDGIGDLEFELGEEGLNAEYYPFITDYIRYDLDYSVTFATYTSADERVECIYPRLSGNVTNIEYLNDYFYTFMKETEKIAMENDCNAISDSYVTYMDEDIISIVFIELYTFDDGSTYESIYCHNYDIKTGTRIYFELLDDSDEFLNELEKRCLVESTSDAPYLFENYSKDDIRNDILTEDFGLVTFYTPLGMEIGLNYEGYWCCSTFKDYEKYIIEIVSETKEAEF